MSRSAISSTSVAAVDARQLARVLRRIREERDRVVRLGLASLLDRRALDRRRELEPDVLELAATPRPFDGSEPT